MDEIENPSLLRRIGRGVAIGLFMATGTLLISDALIGFLFGVGLMLVHVLIEELFKSTGRLAEDPLITILAILTFAILEVPIKLSAIYGPNFWNVGDGDPSLIVQDFTQFPVPFVAAFFAAIAMHMLTAIIYVNVRKLPIALSSAVALHYAHNSIVELL